MNVLTILNGDALEKLKEIPDESIQCCVTSPPYWGLRDYGHEGQIGMEDTPQAFVHNLVSVFQEVKRVLKKDGTIWLNLGDSYSSMRDSKSSPDSLRGKSTGTETKFSGNRNPESLRSAGLKHKDLVGIPWRVAFALQAEGWYLRQDIIWSKPNPMPESVTDRCTKSHEYIFLLTKSEKYFYDNEAIKEPAAYAGCNRGISKNIGLNGVSDFGGDIQYNDRNKRSVWTINTKPFSDAHFATFPEEIPRLCILAGSRCGDMILDPFAGSGTTGKVAIELGRKATLIELNPEYVKIIEKRCTTTIGLPL